MAVKTYRLGSGLDGAYAALFETDQTAASRTDGWTVAKVAAGNSADFLANLKQPSTQFSLDSTTAKPTASTISQCLRTPAPLTGTFANTSWSVTIAVRATTASSQAGRVRLRVLRSTSATGAGNTLLTSAIQVGTTSAALSTSADATSVVTWTAGTTITLINEYLFFEIAWEIMIAGGNTSADVLLRTGQSAAGSHIDTPDLGAAVTKSRPVIQSRAAVIRAAVR